MEKELEKIIYSIKEETGISLNVMSNDGVVSVFTREGDVFGKEVMSVRKITVLDGNTYFPFVFQNSEFTAEIPGSSKVESNYAKLIISYIDSHQSRGGVMGYEDEFKSAVTGDLSRSSCAGFMNRYSVSKSPCFCVMLECDNGKSEEIRDFLNDYSVNGSDLSFITGQNKCVYVKFLDDSVGIDYEYESENEYLTLLQRAIYEETGIMARLFVGSKVKGFLDLNKSYRSCENTAKLANAFGIDDSIITCRDLVLISMLEDMPTARIEEIKQSLIDEKSMETFEDNELLLTAEKFIECNLNMSETARELYVHRNTLTYRLDKIEKQTGLDIRKFNDALVLKIVLLSRKFVE